MIKICSSAKTHKPEIYMLPKPIGQNLYKNHRVLRQFMMMPNLVPIEHNLPWILSKRTDAYTQ